jgi:hypothetical protein
MTPLNGILDSDIVCLYKKILPTNEHINGHIHAKEHELYIWFYPLREFLWTISND